MYIGRTERGEKERERGEKGEGRASTKGIVEQRRNFTAYPALTIVRMCMHHTGIDRAFKQGIRNADSPFPLLLRRTRDEGGCREN